MITIHRENARHAIRVLRVIGKAQFVPSVLSVDAPFAVEIEQVRAVVDIVHRSSTFGFVLSHEFADVFADEEEEGEEEEGAAADAPR